MINVKKGKKMMKGLKKFGSDFVKCIRYTYDANPEMTAIVGVFITLVVLSFVVV